VLTLPKIKGKGEDRMSEVNRTGWPDGFLDLPDFQAFEAFASALWQNQAAVMIGAGFSRTCSREKSAPSPPLEFQRIAAAKAVTMKLIKRSHLSEAMCVLPRHDDIAPMGEVIQPILDLMIQNELENRTLTATRDLLLPELMSGEIRLKNAEDAV
jgi:hypothetical protein